MIGSSVWMFSFNNQMWEGKPEDGRRLEITASKRLPLHYSFIINEAKKHQLY